MSNHCFFYNTKNWMKKERLDRDHIFLYSVLTERACSASKIYLISQKLCFHLYFHIKWISYLSTASFPSKWEIVHAIEKHTFFAQIIDMPKIYFLDIHSDTFLWENCSMFAFIIRYVNFFLHLMGTGLNGQVNSKKKLPHLRIAM